MPSNKIKELLDELASIVAQMSAISESDEAPSEDDAKNLEELENKAEEVKGQIELVERAEKKEKELRSVIERAAPATELPEVKKDMEEKRSKEFAIPKDSTQLRFFEDHDTAYRAGMWLRGFCLGDDYARRWYNDYGHGISKRAQVGRVDGVDQEDPSLGGATVPDEWSKTIIRNVLEYGVFPRFARNVTMNSDVLIQPVRTKGVEVTSIGQNVAAPESDMNFDNYKIIANIWAVQNRIPNSLLEDSVIAMADLVAQEISLAYAEKYDYLGFCGDGTEAGITGVCPTLTDGNHDPSVVAASTATLSELTMEDFTTTMAMLPAWARRGAAWYLSPAAFGLAMTPIAMMAGGNTRLDVAAGPNEARFLGFPVRLVHCMYGAPGAVTGGSEVFALFGDLSKAATLGQRRQVNIKTTKERYIEYDQTALIAFARMGIYVHDVGDDTDAGAMIALVGTGA